MLKLGYYRGLRIEFVVDQPSLNPRKQHHHHIVQLLSVQNLYLSSLPQDQPAVYCTCLV